jgi:hypothetical protein
MQAQAAWYLQKIQKVLLTGTRVAWFEEAGFLIPDASFLFYGDIIDAPHNLPSGPAGPYWAYWNNV